jgi:hypothetical protein
MIHPDRLLRDVAAELYKRTEQNQDILLQYLRKGQIAAVIYLPISGLAPIPINPRFWLNLKDHDFEVRWYSGVRWSTRRFSIPVGSVIEPTVAELRRLIELVFKRDRPGTRSQAQTLPPPLLANFAELTSENDTDWGGLHNALITHLAEIVALTESSQSVYVTAEEWDRFFANIAVATKGPGGRKPLESDAFWAEFVELLKPDRPRGPKDSLIHELKARMEKQSKAAAKPDSKEALSASWIRNRVQDVYKRMGWDTPPKQQEPG